MFIQTDNENNIIQFITIGVKPELNGYEIPDDTPVEILKNIFDYKYINNEFIIKDNVNNEKLNILINKKISTLSKICNQIITNGIDFNTEHYSLTEHDQINLSKLESLAKDGNNVLYHSDGNKCRVYDSEEFRQLTSFAFAFISYNTTYFNLLKSEIENMTSIDNVLSVNYGTKLSEENQNILDMSSFNLPLTIPEIIDTTDYNYIINSNNEAEQLIDDANNWKRLEDLNNKNTDIDASLETEKTNETIKDEAIQETEMYSGE